MFDNRLQPSNEPLIPSSYTTTEQAQPLFTLSAEEVEIVENALKGLRITLVNTYCSVPEIEPSLRESRTRVDNLLTRIKQWQDECNNSK